jgi:hypothetical protein
MVLNKKKTEYFVAVAKMPNLEEQSELKNQGIITLII